MQLEFYDYTYTRLEPTEVKIKQAEPEGAVTRVTGTQAAMLIGTRTNGNYGARVYLLDKNLDFRSTSPAGHTIESVFYYQLQELKTSEQTYTKFRFIN